MSEIADSHAFLPQHLSERVRVIKSHPSERAGAFVLYWMHHAVRAHENPALDVAVWMGNQWNLPVLVYQGLSGRHPYNSDRHHTFIMEGARDVQRELMARGIAYAFYLGEDPDVPSPLHALSDQAALVITEDYPAPPFPRWYRRLAQKIRSGFWAVDAHCIVPMQSIGKSYPRAFQFREKTKAAFTQRVPAAWEDVQPAVPLFDGTLDFEPIDFETADIAARCASCQIDHSIGPVSHTPGGSEAGYQRWDLFKAYGLKEYARLRNNAAIKPPKGVSRLSPYLHHGHVSPFRIAREAAAEGTAGGDKYLDELLVWRELAFNFCYYHDDVESLHILPGWAQKTLLQHASDERKALYSWEELAHGKTGHVLWDAAQQSLLAHGELHNNVRMTWGKAFLQWTKDPETALAMMIDLNHRYALDGSDPNSYGGLLWCLGLFDRPFSPEIPVYGSVRPRSIASHEKRIDRDVYKAYVHRQPRAEALRVGIVGAGFAGLNAARALTNHGIDVHLFEQAEGPGGRLATHSEAGLSFDHGAQYFTVRDIRFKRYVQSWIQQGLVHPWDGQLAVAQDGKVSLKNSKATRFVGVPGMSTLTHHLSEGLHVSYKTCIRSLERVESGWKIIDEHEIGHGPFDVVLLALPPEQSMRLLPGASPLAQQAEGVKMLPGWAVMAAFDQPLDLDYDGLFIHDAPLSWAARNSSKPGRGHRESWLLHGAPAWSESHIDAEGETVIEHLVESFFSVTGHQPVNPSYVISYPWRYALAEQPLAAGCLWDGQLRLGVCGDWLMNSRVEGAFLSGMAAAGRVMGLPDTKEAQSIGIQASLF